MARNLLSTVVTPLVLFGILAAGLSLLNAMPAQIQQPAVQRFDSIEAAQRGAGIKLTLPAYFPDYFSWPPSAIEVNRRPYLTVYLAFTARASGSEALWSYETISREPQADNLVPLPQHVTQMKTFPIKHIQGTLVIGLTSTGETLYQLRWTDGERRHVISTTYSLDELIIMAGSMVR